MSPADCINGCYEALGGLLVFNHCRAVLRDRKVAGVSIASIAAFATWAAWNLYYYPSLGQWVSAAGSVVLMAADCLYLALLLRYRRTP